jgi:hypothetical protein
MAAMPEPWNLEAYVRHFNAKAKKSGVVAVTAEAAKRDEADLRRRYEQGVPCPWPTVRDFAEAEVLLYSSD